MKKSAYTRLAAIDGIIEKNEKLIKPKPIDNTNIIKSIFCFDKQYINEFTEDAQATLKK